MICELVLLFLCSASLCHASPGGVYLGVGDAGVGVEVGAGIEIGAEVKVEVDGEFDYAEWSDDCECHLGDNDFYYDTLYMHRRYQDFHAVRDFQNYVIREVDEERKDFFDVGSDNQTTSFDNEKAFERLRLRPRVLRGVGNIDTTTSLLGDDASFPLGIGVNPFYEWVHPDGEIGVARAAECEGVPYIVSAFSTTDLEVVAAAARHANLWMETYVFFDRSITRSIVERAEAAGYRALVVTVDMPVLGNYVASKRNYPVLPDYLHFPNIETDESFDALKQIQLVKGRGYFKNVLVDQKYERLSRCIGTFGLEEYFNYIVDPMQSWEDVQWIRKLTILPMVIRGIVTGCDAIRAVESGANAIIVGNYEGRTVDTAPAAIEALAEVIEAVDVYQNIEVYLEGGVLWGTDIFKAIAIGADGVFLGRPTVWGMFHSGKCGVRRVVGLLRQELERDMALMGTKHVNEITSTMVVSENYYRHRYRPADVDFRNTKKEDKLECPFGYDYEENLFPSLEDVRELRPTITKSGRIANQFQYQRPARPIVD